jgi:hypothetical protein
MRDYYARGARSAFPPPKVREREPSRPVVIIAFVIAVLWGITALAGTMWLALWAIDFHTLLSFSQLMGLAGAYVLFRLVDKVLFGFNK